ncbi:MAG: hypothetical protein ACYTHJ_20105 [Planctomycetota bacterium]
MNQYNVKLTPAESAQMAKVIYDRTGIFLPDSKLSLLSNRLRALNLEAFPDYHKLLCDEKAREEELPLSLAAVTLPACLVVGTHVRPSSAVKKNSSFQPAGAIPVQWPLSLRFSFFLGAGSAIGYDTLLIVIHVHGAGTELRAGTKQRGWRHTHAHQLAACCNEHRVQSDNRPHDGFRRVVVHAGRRCGLHAAHQRGL